VVLLAIAVGGGGTSAHRRDEYLQASRLAIDPARVEIVLDLTPGIAVAEQVLADVDSNHDHAISPAETTAYASRVMEAIALDVDGVPLRLELGDRTFPAREAVLNGEGTMRIRASASLPELSAGVHHLHYRNTHRPDLGVYLANALVPESPRIRITGQERDIDQRALTVDYELRRAPVRLLSGLAAGVVAAAIWLAIAWARRAR
jgi:hypothetical protein